MIMPTIQQLQNAQLMGWEYIGDGLFAKGEQVGYYTASGFVKG